MNCAHIPHWKMPTINAQRQTAKRESKTVHATPAESATSAPGGGAGGASWSLICATRPDSVLTPEAVLGWVGGVVGASEGKCDGHTDANGDRGEARGSGGGDG